MGWLYNGTTQQYITYAKRAGLNVLVPRWYYMEANGKVTDHTDKELLNWARNNSRQVWAMVGNRGNAEGTHQVLSALRPGSLSLIVLRECIPVSIGRNQY